MFKNGKFWLYISLFIELLSLIGIAIAKYSGNDDSLLKFTIVFIVFCGVTIGAFLNTFNKSKYISQRFLLAFAIGGVALLGNFIIVFFAFNMKLVFYIFNALLISLYIIILIKADKRITKNT